MGDSYGVRLPQLTEKQLKTLYRQVMTDDTYWDDMTAVELEKRLVAFNEHTEAFLRPIPTVRRLVFKHPNKVIPHLLLRISDDIVGDEVVCIAVEWHKIIGRNGAGFSPALHDHIGFRRAR